MDDYLRDLERRAAQGDEVAQREHLCFTIGRLKVEVPVQPSLLEKMKKGSYKGQRVHQKKTGTKHPCVLWQTGDEEQLWDIIDEEKIWSRTTRAVTIAIQQFLSTPGPGGPSLFQNQVVLPVISDPFMGPDQMLLVNPEDRPFKREYSAEFENHFVDSVRYACEAHKKQGESDEAEDQAG